MVSRLALSALCIWGIAAFGASDRLAPGGSPSGFADDHPVTTPVSQQQLPPPSRRPEQPHQTPVQQQAAIPDETPVDIGVPLQPHAPKLRPNNNVCPAPGEVKTSSPLKISVDQNAKRMILTSPDFPNGLPVPVTTGAGRKVPNPDTGVLPFYACTRAVSNKVVTAVRATDFGNRTDCSPRQKELRSTMHWGDSYASRTFTNDDGSGVIMPNAVWANDGGIYIHRAAPAYEKLLGVANGSGGCVRVPGWRKAPEGLNVQTADRNAMSVRTVQLDVRDRNGNVRRVPQVQLEYSETIYKQMNKYGAMELNISEPPPQIIRDGNQEIDVCKLSMAERESYAIANTLKIPVEEARILRTRQGPGQGQGEVFDRIRAALGQPAAPNQAPIQVGTESGPTNLLEFLFGRSVQRR